MTGTIQSTNIVPAASATYSLGSSTSLYTNTYANNYYLGSVNALSSSSGNTLIQADTTHKIYLNAMLASTDFGVLINQGSINFSSPSTATTVGAAGTAATPPLPVGYLKIQIAGVTYSIPYYNP